VDPHLAIDSCCFQRTRDPSVEKYTIGSIRRVKPCRC